MIENTLSYFKNGEYSSAGKNYDEENCKITVWQNWKR